MSNDLLRGNLEEGGIVQLSGDSNISVSHGLYFVNMNRDKSVRILIDRPDGLSLDTLKDTFPNQHPYIDVMNQTTHGFCLSPRPGLEIICDNATSDLAFDVSESRTYRIVLDGQTIATAAHPSEFETLFSERGIKTAYLAKPTVYNCSEYTSTNKISIPIVIVDTSSKFILEITDENGQVIVQNEVGYNASNIGSSNVTGIVGVSKLLGDAYLLNISIAAISANVNSRKWRIALKPNDTNSSLLNPSAYAANGYRGTSDFLPTYLEGIAYWCVDVSEA